MPLRKGSSQLIVSSNIKILVDVWKKDGSIGTSHPATKKRRSSRPLPSHLPKLAKAAIHNVDLNND
jgi:hypothetical protein